MGLHREPVFEKPYLPSQTVENLSFGKKASLNQEMNDQVCIFERALCLHLKGPQKEIPAIFWAIGHFTSTPNNALLCIML